jgi:hypothetical protein
MVLAFGLNNLGADSTIGTAQGRRTSARFLDSAKPAGQPFFSTFSSLRVAPL